MIKKYQMTVQIARFFHWKPTLIIHGIFSMVTSWLYLGIVPLTDASLSQMFLGSIDMGMGLVFLHMFHSAYIEGKIKNVLRDYRTYLLAFIPARCFAQWWLIACVPQDPNFIFKNIEGTYVAVWVLLALVVFKNSERIVHT